MAKAKRKQTDDPLVEEIAMRLSVCTPFVEIAEECNLPEEVVRKHASGFVRRRRGLNYCRSIARLMVAELDAVDEDS